MDLDWTLVAKIVFCIALLGVGIALTWIATKILPSVTAVVSGSLIVAPIVAYFVISGLVTDFSGFGITAKFAELSRRPVTKVLSAEEVAVVDKLADDPNYVRDATFATCRPYYVLREDVLPASTSDDFARQSVLIGRAIYSSLLCGRLEAVVVLDGRGKVIGFFEPDFFRELIAFRLEPYDVSQEEAAAFHAAWPKLIRSSELGVILRNPGPRATSDDARKLFIPDSYSVLQALEKLHKADAPVAVITDPAGRFKGIVTWRRLTGELLLTLAQAGAPR